ncbi:MAG: leucine-rich repeat protein [Tannerella sp.]|jgi:hypothetical protein|nr:leucine-rich repeat protein [Tannerella sp.]
MRTINENELKVFNETYYCLTDDGKSVVLFGCTDKVENITLPAEIDGIPVTQIENAYFPSKRIKWAAKEITIPENIIIGYQAFAYSPIEKVTLKAGVVLQDYAFEYCRQLAVVNMEPGVRFESRQALWKAKRSQTGHMFFDICDVADNLKAPRAWIECFEQKMTTLDLLKEGFEFQSMYNSGVFCGCESLTEIVIPEGIEVLPSLTFCGCVSLCKISLPSSLKAIGVRCFCACKNLVNIVLPEGIVLIGEEAFDSCYRLDVIAFPSTLTHISGNPFSKCKSLNRIVIPIGMDGISSHSNLDEQIYPYASSWSVEMSDFSKDDFYSAKSWKKIFKSKASKITTEMPSPNELEEQCNKAIQLVLGQSEFEKQKEQVAEITNYFIENIGLQATSKLYTKKDVTALKKQMVAYIDSMQQISETDPGNQEQILSWVQTLVEYINDFDQRFMVIETEDRDSICGLIELCAGLAAFPFPEDDPYFDITESWRKW